DIALWCDYVDMLKRLGKDIYNAHFICPDSLQEAHDRVQRKLQTQREREVEARKRQKALENEARFQALKAPFFGIAFTDGTIEVRVLESVQEYMEEGQVLHHCVFDNAYYLKENSLILSACINGKRIETVEVSLETMKVIQCRGLLNKNTEYHDRIIDLVHRNINQIQSCVA
ncbi:PcfJ domain-containing protein, partial [Porphyromonas gulae]